MFLRLVEFCLQFVCSRRIWYMILGRSQGKMPNQTSAVHLSMMSISTTYSIVNSTLMLAVVANFYVSNINFIVSTSNIHLASSNIINGFLHLTSSNQFVVRICSVRQSLSDGLGKCLKLLKKRRNWAARNVAAMASGFLFPESGGTPKWMVYNGKSY